MDVQWPIWHAKVKGVALCGRASVSFLVERWSQVDCLLCLRLSRSTDPRVAARREEIEALEKDRTGMASSRIPR